MNTFNKMFKSVAIAALLLFTAVQLNAQKVEFGLRFMPTVSAFNMKTSTGGTVSGQAVLGFGAGLVLGYNFNDYIGVQGEVIYNSISQKYKEVNTERQVNLRYVNIPLLLSINTGKTKPINLNLVVGPQIGISAGSSVAITGNDSTTTLLAVKKGDLGFAYGGGIDFGLNSSGTIRLGVGFRGVIGLIDISDNNNSTTTNSYYILDRAKVQTYAGYVGLSILF